LRIVGCDSDSFAGELRTTGNTMASIIANQFGEADGLKLSSLIAIGLLLFLITAIINIIGKILIRRARHV
jgi:phosphate transport system permease protein